MSKQKLIVLGGLAPFRYLQVPFFSNESYSPTILVFPRACIAGYDGFVRWIDAGPIVRAVEKESCWMPRVEAEESREWVQPIPCALIRKHDSYSVLKRVQNRKRPDLCSRVSLLVGGHVDQCAEHEPFLTLLLATLRRELYEEIGVGTLPGTRVGVVIDNASIETSRHIGFVYEVPVSEAFQTRACEEFSIGSKLTGTFLTASELCQFSKNFDPWSLSVFENHIDVSGVNPKYPRQITLPGIS